METLIVVLKVLYFAICISLIVIVLFQKGRSAGLSGAIGGMGDTYWSKTKAKSMDGKLQKYTVYVAIAFVVFAVLIQYLENLAR